MKKMITILTLIIFVSTSAKASSSTDKLVAAAEAQIGQTLFYDSSYKAIAYPGGDVSLITGVCADVIIRAYRQLDIDLQKEVHEDMKANFDQYPKIWGLKRTDRNIDHRRVPNLQKFFERHGTVLAKDKDFKPGDIVTWNLASKGSTPHIGIIAKEKSREGTPLVIHNVGWGTKKEDVLFDYTITGHYRYPKKI